MRKWMAINPAETAVSRQKLQEAIDRLNGHYQNRSYLVGDTFTRADLTAAALLAPLHQPQKYDIIWPPLPAEIEALSIELIPQTEWVSRLYQTHR